MPKDYNRLARRAARCLNVRLLIPCVCLDHSPILGHNPPQSPARVKDYGAVEEVMTGSYIPEIQENVEQVGVLLKGE